MIQELEQIQEHLEVQVQVQVRAQAQVQVQEQVLHAADATSRKT